MKEYKILCYGLGPKDFSYNKNTYKFQAIIKTEEFDIGSKKLNVKISNWNYSYNVIPIVNSYIMIVLPFRPKHNISIKITISN